MKTNKKFSKPRATKNTLKVQWGNSAEDGEDLYFTNGDGCPSQDARFLHSIFCNKNATVEYEDGSSELVFIPSLVDELKRRGYDITTLKFSIRKAVK